VRGCRSDSQPSGRRGGADAARSRSSRPLRSCPAPNLPHAGPSPWEPEIPERPDASRGGSPFGDATGPPSGRGPPGAVSRPGLGDLQRAGSDTPRSLPDRPVLFRTPGAAIGYHGRGLRGRAERLAHLAGSTRTAPGSPLPPGLPGECSAGGSVRAPSGTSRWRWPTASREADCSAREGGGPVGPTAAGRRYEINEESPPGRSSGRPQATFFRLFRTLVPRATRVRTGSPRPRPSAGGADRTARVPIPGPLPLRPLPTAGAVTDAHKRSALKQWGNGSGWARERGDLYPRDILRFPMDLNGQRRRQGDAPHPRGPGPPSGSPRGKSHRSGRGPAAGADRTQPPDGLGLLVGRPGRAFEVERDGHRGSWGEPGM
jgi:hypothetical protein